MVSQSRATWTRTTAQRDRVTSARPAQADLYDLLQVSPRATQAVLKAAYRVLARAYHPDVNASPHAAERMRRLNAAYEILSDPDLRARYDADRQRALRVSEARQSPVPPPRVPRTAPRMPAAAGVPGAERSTPRTLRVIGSLAVLLLAAVLLVATLWIMAEVLDEPVPRLGAPVPHQPLPTSALMFELAQPSLNQG